MKKNQMMYLLMLFLFCFIIFNSYYSRNNTEGYINYTLDEATGEIPYSETSGLVQDSYQITGKNGITENKSSDIWWWYPTFKVGSYDQITNNIRYPYRPTNGRCTPASMCGALYEKNNKVKGANYVNPLPPVSKGRRRVGYFNTSM